MLAMDSNSACSDACEKPSGHSSLRTMPSHDVRPESFPALDYKLDYSSMPNYKDLIGPYKDYIPPGNRTPAVGEKIWGDVPYLPSYLDPLNKPREPPTGVPDTLYCRGPFYKGLSETHAEFVNRGVQQRKFQKYVRHYWPPGLKYDKSVTYTDYQPPLPMRGRDKTPCLKEEDPKPWYKPVIKKPKNPHAKEHEVKPPDSQVVYVDDPISRDFRTEHNDHYVCFHEPKTGTKVKDPLPVPEEMFLKHIREAHQKCTHPDPSSNFCDGSCKARKHCPGASPRRTSWLLHPKNYTFENGVMLIPCKCRYDNS